jgi:hypothetical protein
MNEEQMEFYKRATRILNLESFSEFHTPILVKKVDNLINPYKEQKILRMIIKEPFEEFRIPEELLWIKDLLDYANEHQKILNINSLYCYVTIRHGIVDTENDDLFHIDGFSMQYTHLPEQNYIWSNLFPTQYIAKAIEIPKDFNPLVHNIHKYSSNQS